MTFFKLWKRFLAIFKSKLSRTLDELDSIKDRCQRIKDSYEEAVVKLDVSRTQAEANLLKYKDLVTRKSKEIDDLGAALLRADDAQDLEAVESFNKDIEAEQTQLDVLQEALTSFQEQVDELDEEAADLQDEIRKAEHTLLLAETRYETAKDLMTHSGTLTDSLRKQIDQVRKDADDMSYRHKGAKKVREKSKPKSEEARKKYATTSMSAQDRIQALRNKNAGITPKGE